MCGLLISSSFRQENIHVCVNSTVAFGICNVRTVHTEKYSTVSTVLYFVEYSTVLRGR
jgi:hypothetical protein